MKRELKRALDYYNEVISEDFVRGLEKSAGVSTRSSLFQSSVVIWLMIYQRLSADGTLSAAIRELQEGASGELLLSRAFGSIRARGKKVSSNTGGYAKARGRVDLSVVEGVSNELTKHLLAELESEPAVFIIDGSSVTIAHSEVNTEQFPQYENHYGKSHYPLVRLGVAVHAQSGVALPPAFGAFNGEQAVSEHAFIEPLLAKMPAESTVLADRYYSCFYFIERAAAHSMKSVVRLNDRTFKKLVGELPTSKSGEAAVQWTPSAHDKKRYPEHEDASGIMGRCLWQTIKIRGKKPVQLLLFTTSDKDLDEIVHLYGLRWDVETDLADLKTTLKMSFIDAKSPDVIKKEIILGVLAYNLVRRLMVFAARKLRTTARRLSFINALRSVRSLGSVLLDSETSQKTLNERIEFHLLNFHSLLLPKQKSKRPTTPRTKWRKGNPRYTTNKSIH